MAAIMGDGRVIGNTGLAAMDIERAADLYRLGLMGDKRSQKLFGRFAAANPLGARTAIDFVNVAQSEAAAANAPADLIIAKHKSAGQRCLDCGSKVKRGSRACMECGKQNPLYDRGIMRKKTKKRFLSGKAASPWLVKSAKRDPMPYGLTPRRDHDDPAMREIYFQQQQRAHRGG